MNAAERVKTAQSESEATRDRPLPDTAKGARRGRSVVQSVRLPEADFRAIEAVAAEQGVPVGALIRGWVLEGLATERDSTLREALDKLTVAVQRAQRRLAASEQPTPL